MATFWEIAAHSVDHMFSLCLTICNLSYFPFWFFGVDLGFDCSVPDLSFFSILFSPFSHHHFDIVLTVLNYDERTS